MKNNPTILYICKGWIHLCYAVWSIRSLQIFDYKHIEVIVSNKKERSFFQARFPDIVCNILNVDTTGYPSFSYKPFVLKNYLNNKNFQNSGRDIVVCDADILWKADPKALFRRINGKIWAQKITAIDPNDYLASKEDISPINIGLLTIKNYESRFQIDSFPSYRVNAGLFQITSDLFKIVIDNWMEKINSLPGNEMLMSEALLSLTMAELGLKPYCDKEDIKFFGVHESTSSLKVKHFCQLDKKRCDLTGYQIAKHYYSDQRSQLHRDAIKNGFDSDGLIWIIRLNLLKKFLLSIHKLPMRALKKIRRIYF